MHTRQTIQSLLDDYITGSLDTDGREELYQVFQDPAYEALLSAMMDEALEERLAGSYHFPETAGRVKSNLMRQIRESGETRLRPVSIRRRLRAWVAAAAAILAIALAWYLYEKPAAPPEQANAQPAPGSNKAVLVLADGSTVQLDSTSGRQISQGQTAIQQQNGSLQYTATRGSGAQGFNTLRTPRGGQFQVTLHDGTRVWLNSASSLKYPVVFNNTERTVELVGQGYFEIAADTEKPFKVKINQATEVQVLGTSFDVMAYPDEQAVKTTLLQGAVRVMHKASTQTLRPGQQAVMEPDSREIAVHETDVSRVTDWKNGLFIFNNTDLPAILREVARWYDVDIIYQAPPNKNLYGGGLSRKMALADVLLFLEEGGANHFKIEGRKVIVLP
ncbi:FecR domain-containing protein [Chitinophaga pollutisoli]|uniref:FecR domain-containing protein n=1 Tax=Chitinophaga pollutisoli TaxID=3133966 RepID=A0ABZ2YTJ1_9BACT